MTETLTIDRMVARTADDGSGLPVRVERMMRHVADDRLERLLVSNSLGGDGDWCISDVAVSAVLDMTRPDSSLEEAIARAVLDAITVALAEGAVIHYPRMSDAVADLVVSASLGRFDRAWAWRSIGLVADLDELQRRPGPCVLDIMARHSCHALPAVLRGVGAVGLAALHRLFTPAGWVRLADTVLDAYMSSPTRTEIAVALHSRHPVSTAVTAADARRASRLILSSSLAASVWASRLRLDDQTLRALAILVLAESEPAMLRANDVVPLWLALAHLAAGTLPAVAGTAGVAVDSVPPVQAPGAAATDGLPANRPRRRGLAEAATLARSQMSLTGGSVGRPDDANVGEPAEPVGDITHHAGLLFLLNAAADAMMPETLLDDPALAGVAASELLARVALLLDDTDDDDDPAVLAFAGSDATRLRPGWSCKALAPHVLERVEAHAGAWAAAAAARLRRGDEDPLDVMTQLTRRIGRIEREQGWMEVHLALADVDVDVRLAGLDIDPGWVPWVGAVVRFRYA